MPHFPAAAAAGRVGLLGGESAGKTTLAQALAGALRTHWVPEYGRERWLEIGGTFSLDELLQVARIQAGREDEALPRPEVQASGWLVCDTTPLTTLVYALIDHGQAPPALWTLARRRYDRLLLCAPDFGFVQDGARRDDGFRQEQHALTLRLLRELGHAWIEVHGPPPTRLAQALEATQPPGAGAQGGCEASSVVGRVGLEPTTKGL